MPDHPRIRGEHFPRHRRQRSVCGSSPHTRGAQCSTTPRRITCRIIPAYAGSTRPTSPPRCRRRDHPRIRGEHRATSRTALCAIGSSPHTRGAQPLFLAKRRDHRIIPAYAGSTVFDNPAKDNVPDHPRIRGEHRRTGTPSRPRGRIIPAYAGSTFF